MNIFFGICIVFAIVMGAVGSKKAGDVPPLPKGLIMISRVAAVICVIIALTMILDLFIPKQSFEVTISKTEDSKVVSFGIYSENMNLSAYNKLQNGEKAKIHVSRIYDEIKDITLIDHGNATLEFPTVDGYAFLLIIVMLLVPAVILLKKSYETSMEKYIGLNICILSIIMGFIGVIVIGKLLLVHVLHIIPIM